MKSRCVLCFLVLLLLAAATGCRKEKDTQAPVILLNSPTDHQVCNVFTDLAVTGEVHDDQQLLYIRIQLLDQNNIPVLPPVTLYPDGPVVTLNQAYPLNDVLLESGTYILQVQASDGTQATNHYVVLTVNEAPRKLKYFVAVTQTASGLEIVKIDSAFQRSTLAQVSGDFLRSAVCNDYQLFYISGCYTGDVLSYDMSEWLPVWQVPVTIDPPFAWFSGLMADKGYLWVGYRNGKYEKYDRYGDLKMSVNTYYGWSPRRFCRSGDKLVIEEKNPGGSDIQLCVRYEFSGAIDGVMPTTENTVALIPIRESDICHITNTLDGQAHHYMFSTTYIYEDEPWSVLGPGRARCATAAGDKVLIGHDLGVYLFNPDNLNLDLWLTGVTADQLFYEDLNGWVVVGAGTQLQFFLNNYPQVTPVTSIELGDSVLAVHGVYNKDN